MTHLPIFRKNCDSSRDYKDISSLLSANGASDTLDYMKQYWVDINGQNEQFWEHEWSTHGTCYSTLEPSCLGSSYYKGEEAVDFFNTVVKLFKVGVICCTGSFFDNGIDTAHLRLASKIGHHALRFQDIQF